MKRLTIHTYFLFLFFEHDEGKGERETHNNQYIRRRTMKRSLCNFFEKLRFGEHEESKKEPETVHKDGVVRFERTTKTNNVVAQSPSHSVKKEKKSNSRKQLFKTERQATIEKNK